MSNDSSQNNVAQCYRFPYRINLPLLLLFWEARQIGTCFLLIGAGNVLEMMGFFFWLSVVYWILYDRAKKEGKRGLLRHKVWWLGVFPGGVVFSSRYFTDPFIREMYS